MSTERAVGTLRRRRRRHRRRRGGSAHLLLAEERVVDLGARRGGGGVRLVRERVEELGANLREGERGRARGRDGSAKGAHTNIRRCARARTTPREGETRTWLPHCPSWTVTTEPGIACARGRVADAVVAPERLNPTQPAERETMKRRCEFLRIALQPLFLARAAGRILVSGDSVEHSRPHQPVTLVPMARCEVGWSTASCAKCAGHGQVAGADGFVACAGAVGAARRPLLRRAARDTTTPTTPTAARWRTRASPSSSRCWTSKTARVTPSPRLTPSRVRWWACTSRACGPACQRFSPEARRVHRRAIRGLRHRPRLRRRERGGVRGVPPRARGGRSRYRSVRRTDRC